MYVWGVAVRTGRFVLSISIGIPRLVCLLCLLRVVRNTVLRCAAAKITIDSKAPHHTVRAAFLSMLADVAAVAVAVVLSIALFW